VHFRFPNGQLLLCDVYRAVDASTDPELARRALATTPAHVLNSARGPDGELHPIDISFVYHDPDRRIFALVLPHALRYRELRERGELFIALGEETSVPIPRYVLDFAVVYGPDGLAALLEASASQLDTHAHLSDRRADIELLANEVARRERALAARETLLDAREADLEHLSAQLARQRDEWGDNRSTRRRRHRRTSERDAVPVMEENEEVTSRYYRSPNADVDASHLVGFDAPGPLRDTALEDWMATRETTLKSVDDGNVRLAASLPAGALEELLDPEPSLRFQLHRFPSYPLVTLSVGRESCFCARSRPPNPIIFFFDVGQPSDRAVLEALAREFALIWELYDSEYLLVRSCHLSAELEANVQVALEAADRHLAGVPQADRSLELALKHYWDPNFDRFAENDPEAGEFRPETWRSPDTAGAIRRALVRARRYSQGDSLDYLVLTRGYSLSRWRREQRALVKCALAAGLWVGDTMAALAVEEGMAGSRAALLQVMEENFAALTAASAGHDLSAEAVRENRTALAAERSRAGKIGRLPRPRSTPIHSGTTTVASGEIGGSGAAGRRRRTRSRTRDTVVEVMPTLEGRLDEVLEMCRSQQPELLPEVFAALGDIEREHAASVLVELLGFGSAVVPEFTALLKHSAGYLRQGGALALSMVADLPAIEALSSLLLAEPTEIWREVARALGQVGPAAVMSLAGRWQSGDDSRERIATALAYIAARHGRACLEPARREPDASPVLRRVDELIDLAGRDDADVRRPRFAAANRRPDAYSSELNEYQSFSCRFFQAFWAAHGAQSTLETGVNTTVLEEPEGYERVEIEEPDGNDLATP
jgi:hypothetical protein